MTRRRARRASPLHKLERPAMCLNEVGAAIDIEAGTRHVACIVGCEPGH